MEVLILGGTGTISTGITQQLYESDHDVTLFNRGRTEARIPDDVPVIEGDRTDFDTFERRMQEFDRFDCVIDMICFTAEEAESAVRAFGGRIDQFIFCSTIDVYSRPVAKMPVVETASHRPPVSDYGAQKSKGERIFMDAHDRGDFATTVIRPWDTYGEGNALNHTFGKGTEYIDRIRRGKPIIVHGDGNSVWGSCHRDDVGRAFVNAVGNETAYGEAYHVTSEECMSWNRYHREVAAALDAPDPELVHIPTEVLIEAVPDRTSMLRKHYRFSTVFDNTKAKTDLDFEQRIPWREGVRRTVGWLDDRDMIEDSDGDPTYERLIEEWQNTTTAFVRNYDN